MVKIRFKYFLLACIFQIMNPTSVVIVPSHASHIAMDILDLVLCCYFSHQSAATTYKHPNYENKQFEALHQVCVFIFFSAIFVWSTK